MEDILFQDQKSYNNGQALYYSPEKAKCSPGDLIMITNSNGKFLFDHFDNCGESPVFKVLNVRYDCGEVLLRLKVMEVYYPVPVFHHESQRANMLQAIRQGLAVVQESQKVFDFRLNREYRAIDIELREVQEITPISVQSTVAVSGDCEAGISGQVIPLDLGVNTNQYFVTLRPTCGRVDLQAATGEWCYHTHRDELERDCFEITVWNGLGGYATQRIMVRCECMDISKVEVVNLPLPVVACHPLPVTVVGIPEVTLEGLVEVTIPDVVTITGSVNIHGMSVVVTPTVNIANTVPVTIVELADLGTFATNAVSNGSVTVNGSVGISGTPTVYIGGQPIEVSVVELPEVIEVTVVSLPSVSITGCVCVSVNGTPTVHLADEPIEVSVVELPEVIEVTVVSLPSVSITGCVCVSVNGTPTVYIGGQPIEVSVVSLPELIEVTVTNSPTVYLGDQPIVVTTIENESIDTNLAALSFSEIITTVTVIPGSTTTLLYDLSRSSEHTFFTHLIEPSEAVSITARMVVSPTTNEDYFYVTSVTDVVLSASNKNYPFVSFHWGKYLGVAFENDTSTTANVEVFAQSQGGPISSITITN